ncbi:hypothetical protein [Streptomyces pacificus]|uniref:LigA protein n=1 Tax=Streptomyces pacificus TaxID=2705029 RepID=A0A6A0B1K5_9ACTN|nr:hypothetical protein [Streptomyces pacificus]GFH38508.1 hypothetical protein SCWH03_47500 [Streptomyces pacificus]
MTRTTPERPLDIEAVFPALTAHRGTATRLHPRPGSPEVGDSSVGGPFLWPADEPWPMCTAPHDRTSGYRPADVRRQRAILAEAWGRASPQGPTDAERAELASLTPGPHAPHLGERDPVPLVALAQLTAQDVPGLEGPEGCDVLQVLWCPFEAHGPRGNAFDVVLKWRHQADVKDVLASRPEPVVIGRAQGLPDPCVLDPEQVVEHEYIELLDEDLQEAIEEWEEGQEEAADGAVDEAVDGATESVSYPTYEAYEAAMRAAEQHAAPVATYTGDLSIAPGWKVGGFASWHLTGPAPVERCACGTPMSLLLTVTEREWDNGTQSWVPAEDQELIGVKGANIPTAVSPARGTMYVFTCPIDPSHPHRTAFQ